MKRLKTMKQLRTNGGFAVVEYLFGGLLIMIFAAILIGIVAAGNTKVTLEQFADEMATRVGMLGKCDDTEIDALYSALCQATGLTPEMTIQADEYINAKGRTVQYGEAIYLDFSLPVDQIGLGDYAIPFLSPMTTKKITQSEQYWKGD